MRGVGPALSDAPTAKREAQWYERKYHEILRDQLSDHCSVQSYAAKVVHLRDELIPYFRTIKLEKEMLSEIIDVQLMPFGNQAEGRVLEREMRKDKTFDDPDAVLAACTAIVSGNTDSTIEDARRDAGSMPEGAPRVAAMAAGTGLIIIRRVGRVLAVPFFHHYGWPVSREDTAATRRCPSASRPRASSPSAGRPSCGCLPERADRVGTRVLYYYETGGGQAAALNAGTGLKCALNEPPG